MLSPSVAVLTIIVSFFFLLINVSCSRSFERLKHKRSARASSSWTTVQNGSVDVKGTRETFVCRPVGAGVSRRGLSGGPRSAAEQRPCHLRWMAATRQLSLLVCAALQQKTRRVLVCSSRSSVLSPEPSPLASLLLLGGKMLKINGAVMMGTKNWVAAD